jgi:hypothetical protein
MTRYITIKVDGKTKQLHRHAMELHLGRKLREDEHVHHKDRNRYNNSIDNLEVKIGLAHIRDHAEERRVYPRSKSCHVCGTVFTPHPTKRKRQLTCSKVCADTLRSISEKATKSGSRQVLAAIVRCNVPELAVRFGRERAVPA